jgi:dTDP-4-amino-4,6-dideoxygalactose transaminase
LPDIIARRRELADRYRRELAGLKAVVTPQEPVWARSNWQSYCVRLIGDTDQRAVMQSLLDAGIASRRGIMCSHREPAYRTEPWSCGERDNGCGCPPESCKRLARSEEAQDGSIILPLYHQMTEAEQDQVIAALYAAFRMEPGRIGAATR